jgi:hypothetical protein
LPGRAVCSRCNQGIGRERGTCVGCAKPDRLLDYEHRCRWCRQKARNRCPDCQSTCTALISIDGTKVCDPCALRRHLGHVLPLNGTGPLHPLREVILCAEPLTTRRWLNRSSSLLEGLDHGRIPLTHESLDALPKRKAAEHLRALLIATGILDPDPGRALRRLEATIPALLAPLDAEHRKLTTRWVQWAVLPRLRALDDRPRIATAVSNARRKIEQTVAFFTELQHAGRDLGECTQHDVDVWFAGPGAARWQVGPFLTWARQRRHLPAQITLPASNKGTPGAPADAEERWQIAQRLVRDDTLDPVDRIAGALVVLYAQPLARIVALTTDDVIVTDSGVHLKLGTDALELPEPFATLIQQLPYRRRASTADQLPTRWLFAGGHADKPLTVSSLGTRLRAIGIQPRRLRLAAAEQLAREIPPAMLAGVLGLRIASINRHTTDAKGQWANYAADRRH